MDYRNRTLTLALTLALGAVPAFASRQTTPGSAQTAPPAAQPPAAPPAAQPPAPRAAPPAAAPQGPAPAPGGGRDCMDQSYDFSMTGPDEWKRATDTSSITVPGEVRCVWSPDGTTILVAFVQKVHRPTSPRTLLTQSASAIQKGLGATVPEQSVRDVGGMRAMWMVVNGKGTGAALTATGDVPTAQHWVAIPRAQDIVIFLLTAPQDKFADQDQIFQTALQTLKVGGAQTPEQKAAQ